MRRRSNGARQRRGNPKVLIPFNCRANRRDRIGKEGKGGQGKKKKKTKRKYKYKKEKRITQNKIKEGEYESN